jgi:hypothetical protein
MTLAHGKPLGFLDHQRRVGNSLVGASPADLWRTGIERGRRSSETRPLFDAVELDGTMRHAAVRFRELMTRPDDSLHDVRAKEALWRQLAASGSQLDAWRRACSLWCARFFWNDAGAGQADVHRPSAAECRAAIDAMVRGDATLAPTHVRRLADAAARMAARLGFFHWPLEFPDVFYDDSGTAKIDAGFDAVIGNPPWEMLRRDEGGDAGSSTSSGERRDLIDFIRGAGFYPCCRRGHVNLYQPFLERALALVRPGGRIGLLLPWGLATDDGATELRRRVVERCGQVTIVGLDNADALFPIHRGLRFAAVALTKDALPDALRVRFGVRTNADIDSLPDVDEVTTAPAFFRLHIDTLKAIGGAARRIPDLRRLGDLDWLRQAVRASPPLGAPDGWNARFGRELNATDDRASFGTTGLPVIEGKHLSPFAVAEHATPLRIEPAEALRLLPDRRHLSPRLGYRDVSGVGNRLSLIAAIVPGGVVTTHTVFCLRTRLPPVAQLFLCGVFNSFVLNAVVRMLMGAHVTTSLVEGLPVPRWSGSPAERRIARLAGALARHPDSARLQAALQAGVARLYGFDDPTRCTSRRSRWGRRSRSPTRRLRSAASRRTGRPASSGSSRLPRFRTPPR